MAKKNVSGIVKPAVEVPAADRVDVTAAPIRLGPARLITKRIVKPRPRALAPAWFYSALGWLGESYVDANLVEQSFELHLAGSDVDPYTRLGATRLFSITKMRDRFRLSIAPDLESPAPPGGAFHAATDDGIRDMYIALSTSAIFSAIKYCYVPTRIGRDLDPERRAIEHAYDPATGIRAIVLGSALSQVVPLDEFTRTANEQVYNPSPTIVPIVTALVYDVTRYNELGAKTFTLPVCYTRDRIGSAHHVNRLGATADAGFDYGQTVAFEAGPGYDAASATPLQLAGKSSATVNGRSVSTYTFSTARVVSITQVGARVRLGLAELTYTGNSLGNAFAQQRIAGFYQDRGWSTCLGLPIYDFGTDNARFTAETSSPFQPTPIYDPARPFLNGGALPAVLGKLHAATDLHSRDQMVAMLDGAIRNRALEPGLGVTTAALDFKVATASSTDVVDELGIPVIASVTTTPPKTRSSRPSAVRRLVAAPGNVIGGGANTPDPTAPSPITVQASLLAFVPREALAGTGIASVQLGTAFPAKSLGDATAFATASPRTLVLTERRGKPAASPFDLAVADVKEPLVDGIRYVFALEGTRLSVRGGDGSSRIVQLANGAPTPHVFVGAAVHAADTTTVRLYPKLHLEMAAPTVGSHGVEAGARYHVKLTFDQHSTYDLSDDAHAVLASSLPAHPGQPLDGSQPRAGDLYFGSFRGGDSKVNLWAVPVFLTVGAADLPQIGAGSVTLEAQVNGLPDVKLQVTDSSLFVYAGVDIAPNVFLASAVINTAPHDRSAAAYAPTRVLMGVVRRVRIGAAMRYAFVPADDSIQIGSARYITSIIEIDAIDFDPNTRPYPPIFWPKSRFWQFANRHVPYRDVGYTGGSQDARVARAEQDAVRIGVETAERREPMHMYLDASRRIAKVWPIYEFPLDRVEKTVDFERLRAIGDTVLAILATPVAERSERVVDALAHERIAIPEPLEQPNPFAFGALDVAPNTTLVPATMDVAEIENRVKPVSASLPLGGLRDQQSRMLRASEETAAARSLTKSYATGIAVVQERAAIELAGKERPAERKRQRIFGYSVHDPGTGEAYLVELVDADQAIPDQLPRPTENATYDPFYVRVVVLHTMTAYNMSIIVPAMVHDQHGHIARQGAAYVNRLAKTHELGLGYLYTLYDETDNFDELTFGSYPPAHASASSEPLFTNVPYATAQTGTYNPALRFVEGARRKGPPPPYFLCRRKNWSATCHLLQASHAKGSLAYLAFGAGDLIPLRLDSDFEIDKRSPAHLYKLTYTFSDRAYNSARTVTVANKPYVVAVTDEAGVPQFRNFSINATAGTADLALSANEPLAFPAEIYVVGQASTTLTSLDALGLANTGELLTRDGGGVISGRQEFQLIAYNNLVYVVRAVANVPELATVGGLGAVSGLLVDTFVPAASGNLVLAQAARHRRSGLSYFGQSYTPTTMADSLDNLDFTSITGDKFRAPTIFIPIPELDAMKGFVATISNFVGRQFWTFIYPEIVARANETVNSVLWPDGKNIDADGKPILSLQKLQFVYDPLVVMFTPNDLAHAYELQAKQQVLALTNGQIQEGICWRSANVQPQRQPPRNIRAQQIIPPGPEMDAANIIFSPHNRPVTTSIGPGYLGMSVNSFVGVSGVTYNIEESALQNDQTGTSFMSAVSSISNMVVGVLFDYDNNDLGTLVPYDPETSTKGVVFLNGYLGANGYNFSSPDHFDVDDVLVSQVPLLEQIATTMGQDVAFFDTDASLPRQFWSMTYDALTAPGVPNFIANVPPSPADPGFSNRTRSLLLSLQNPLQPDQIGVIDTFSSIVSANLHLTNGVTGAIFISKKADRDVASIGSNPTTNSFPLYGMPENYDFFLFSRDHYWTLKGATFELVDHGYAMVLVDDGAGTGTKVAKYWIDEQGTYRELYSCVIYSPNGGVLEALTFTVDVALGDPSSVDPQAIAAQINATSKLVYAAFGPATPGAPPATIPIQAVAGGVPATPISGAPDFDGYLVNVTSTNRQPVRISELYVGPIAYAIAGATTVAPADGALYGSLSHGLDRQLSVPSLQSSDLLSVIPRPTVPPGPSSGTFGGTGLGALIGTPLSRAFQGSAAIPPAIAANPTPGTTMAADDAIFYTFNALAGDVMDSDGNVARVEGTQYFIDTTDAAEPIHGIVSLPRFTFNGATYAVNLNTTAGGVSRYTLVVAGTSYVFEADNAHVTVDRTRFTFGADAVGYASIDQPAGDVSPSPIELEPFTIAAGGRVVTIDVFNNAGALGGIVLGVLGRVYAYDPIAGTVTITAGATTTTVAIATGKTFVSRSGYGYVIDFVDGDYAVNGSRMFPYSAATTGNPVTHPLLTAPQMFTRGGNFYTFDRDADGAYVSVTGSGQVYPINPYQFSINGTVYIIDTTTEPNAVVGGGNRYRMFASNTQFVIEDVQYTITPWQGGFDGATVSGQFNISQGNVVVVENYVYQIDTLNAQIVGNGSRYPLTTSGATYTITTKDKSFTVTTEPNATTVTLGGIVHQINSTTVVGDGIAYPILVYRTFDDGGTRFRIGNDGVVYVPTPLPLAGATFSDGATTYTVDGRASFDGTTYFPITGDQFTAAGRTYTLRSDAVAIAAGPATTYLGPASGAPSPNQFTFGPQTIFHGRPSDLAAFDGQRYYAIVGDSFTDTNTGLTYTLSGDSAVHEGNSYEIFSNLGEGQYFEVPGGPIYFVNIVVADLGTAAGDVFGVFPIANGRFTIPLRYTIAVAAGVVTVDGLTLAGPTVIATLTGAGTSLTGGFFIDPVTKITYTCLVDGTEVRFVDSNNATYGYDGTAFVATVVVATEIDVAVDDQLPPVVYPIREQQFRDGTSTFAVDVPVAFANAAGPYFPMVDGRFIVPRAAPLSSIAYSVRSDGVTKGYVVSIDDVFTVDGTVFYTVNAVNVVRATNQATLTGGGAIQTLVVGGATYTLDETTSQASTQPAGLTYDAPAQELVIDYHGLVVTYTIGGGVASDDRVPQNTFPVTTAGTQLTFTDTLTATTFTFDGSGSNPVTAVFGYVNHFFIDTLAGVTYYVDRTVGAVVAISYLPETTHHAFTPADGRTYLIHYDDVAVVFPVISGTHVNAGVATVGSDIFTVEIDRVDPTDGSPAIPINSNSFEINGNLYTITGTPAGANYSACFVEGHGMTPRPFLSADTFRLGDPSITYTLQLDAANLPAAIVARFPIQASRNLIAIANSVYIITYHTVETGSLLGQGSAAIAIADSRFTLANPRDATTASFIFANPNIFNAASVVGRFGIYVAPTFSIEEATFTLDPVRGVVTDQDRRPYPLLPDPMMFSIDGANYVIDSNRIPHAIIGNTNVSPISTNVTALAGDPVPHSTFTLNGLVFRYIEDANGILLAIAGTKSSMIAQPAGTFTLDSGLEFTISTTPPAAGTFPSAIVPIATATAGAIVLNIYPGTPESGGADYFTYKNTLYTLVSSTGTYVAVRKAYTVYAARPRAGQHQLAVFDLRGTTYIVTDGSMPGATAEGINPGTLWAATATSNVETQFGLVYGFERQPTTVTRSSTGRFQFIATGGDSPTLYDIFFTAGGNANVVQIDVPELLPTFTQTGPFTFTPSYPLMFETGGYNAYTTFVAETAEPSIGFAGAYDTPVRSIDPLVDTLVTNQGDFSLELWHSIPSVDPLDPYTIASYSAGSTAPLVYFATLHSENDSLFVGINNTVLRGTTTPPVFSDQWRHVALTYEQPYTMLCTGAGFEAKRGNSYNVGRDFSIAMTFSVSDATTTQGLLYKGTGADVPPPQTVMSYRVAVSNNRVTLQLTDAASQVSPVFEGTADVQPDRWYELIIVKATTTPLASEESPDPYIPPFDVGDLGTVSGTGDVSGFPEDGGTITVSSVAPTGTGATTKLAGFVDRITNPPSRGYRVTISVREVFDDGTFGPWSSNPPIEHAVTNGDPGLSVNATGAAHLLIGHAFDDNNTAMPLGGGGDAGNIRKVYLFNRAINRDGIQTDTGLVEIANASSETLLRAGLVAQFSAAYDPDGRVYDRRDPENAAITTNQALATLAPLAGHEREGATLYLNGVKIQTELADRPAAMSSHEGTRELVFNGGRFRLAEIGMWRTVRQPYQVVDDMFGRLIPTNEPQLVIYLSGSFAVPAINAPILPLNKYIDNVAVVNPVATMNLAFEPASLDLAGCPAVGRCGPLVTPNLYTPPGVALTVCDTPPYLTSFTLTVDSQTGTLAGVVDEAYVYVKDGVLTLYAGKKIGDLVLSWVSQEQGDVQLIGYIEGAPPVPMANLTKEDSYAGATSVKFTAPTSAKLTYQKTHESATEHKIEFSDAMGAAIAINMNISPFGFGVELGEKTLLQLELQGKIGGEYTTGSGNDIESAASLQLEESNSYTVNLDGALAPITNDPFMAGLNTVTTPSAAPGAPSSQRAILPNPNLGGFTASNPPAALPSAPADEKLGSRMFVPSPYGQAFVTSTTLDVYQQTLLQTNTVFGFIRIPNAEIPRDFNIVSFRMNSRYLRPGCIDGVIGYVYNPAKLSTGEKTHGTSTGQLQVLYDKNFSRGSIGNAASYMRIVEAYKLKRQIDQQAFNALALYRTRYDGGGVWPDRDLTPGLDFYNEYVWSSRGGIQEVKHTYTTTYEEVYATSSTGGAKANVGFNIKLGAAILTIFDINFGYEYSHSFTSKWTYNTSAESKFEIEASFDGVERDTQMRYASNNDAHFVMKNNSMFDPNNQSGLNLVIGSDGLVYNITPNVSSGAGLPTSNNIDDAFTYTQPQPSYAGGNANGLTGALEPYDRPGKVKLYRTYMFFLQPTDQNAESFWNTVVDPVWLENSDEADARALRSARGRRSIPWRLLYRVTYCERFLPPIASEDISVPDIQPVMAVPVLDAASDFLFKDVTAPGPRPAKNPANDLEANVVLVTPTQSGARAGTAWRSGPNTGNPVLPNNTIPFELARDATSIVHWRGHTNARLLTQLLGSVLGTNIVEMSPVVRAGSMKRFDVMDPVGGGTLYSVYTDPDGNAVNVPVKTGVTVYQDVNGNPIQYFDGKTFHSLQRDYVATTDGTVMYYVQPPPTYDQTKFDIVGNYDLYGHPGDEWRYFLVSGISANMTAEPNVTNAGPFVSSSGMTPYTGFSLARAQHAADGTKQVKGYVLAQGILQWPQLNTSAQVFADVLVYKAMSLLDAFPIGDPSILDAMLRAEYPAAPFVDNPEICLVFTRNIFTYFNAQQQALLST